MKAISVQKLLLNSLLLYLYMFILSHSPFRTAWPLIHLTHLIYLYLLLIECLCSICEGFIFLNMADVIVL